MDTQPAIRQALGKDWERLAPALRRHYDVAPGEDRTMSGRMEEIRHASLAAPLILAARLCGALVGKNGRDIPARVRNWAVAGDSALCWRRSFQYPGGKNHIFESRMEYAGEGEVVEYVRWGLGIRLGLAVEDGALRYTSRGYRWRLGGLSLSLPDWLFLGRADIVEKPEGDNSFSMAFHTRHPLWGETFCYRGRFELD